MSYGTPGPYKSGLWMVSNGKNAYVVDRTHLPSGRGWRYYWLGNGNNSPGNLPLINVLANAADDLGMPIPTQSGDSGPQAYNDLANQIAAYWNGDKPVTFQLPHENAGNVISEILGSPLPAIGVGPALSKLFPGGGAAGAAEGGAAGGVASKAASAAKSAAKTIASNPAKTLGALTLAGLFTNVGWWKGAGMVLAGAILVVLALRQMAF